MKYHSLFFIILAISCGKKKVDVNSPQPNISLVNEITRIESNLQWCGGMVSSASNLTNPWCDGDATCYQGHYQLLTKTDRFNWLTILNEQNQPFRHPNRVNLDKENEFSRDQLLGVMEASIYSASAKETLAKIFSFSSKHNNKFCLNPTDNRCDLTTSMYVLYNDLQNKAVLPATRQIDYSTRLIEAKTVPDGYQVNLLSRSIYLHAITGNLTTGYVSAHNVLYKRFPNNLLVHTNHCIFNKCNSEEWTSIQQQLLQNMKIWKQNGNKWAFDENLTTNSSPYGHELVSLAKFIEGLPK